MIQVDISNIWGQLSLPDLLAIEAEVSRAFDLLTGEDAPLCRTVPEAEILRLEQAADQIRRQSDACVVIGAGSGSLAARAAMELLQSADRDLRFFFTGDSFSARRWETLTERLEERDLSVIVLSGAEASTESAVALRCLRWMMARRYGTDEANRRIYAVAVPDSPLAQMAEEAGWETFFLPEKLAGRYEALTAAGLLPMAAAGLDIRQLLQGAAQLRESCAEHSLENPLWQYAAVRSLMLPAGKQAELLAVFEPDAAAFGSWWRMLFSGPGGAGLFPMPVIFTGDLHALSWLLREEGHRLFETMLRFEASGSRSLITSDWKDPEGINYLEDKTLDQVNSRAWEGTLEAHVDSGIPVITMDCGQLCESALGSMFCFFQLACALSAHIRGTDPFLREEEALWQKNTAALLGR